jgi:hypothetical protein
MRPSKAILLTVNTVYRPAIAACLLLITTLSSNARQLAAGSPSTAVWQWSVPVQGNKGPVRAFLWIPENCKQVRGIIVAQHNMEEISILIDPAFRRTMAELGFAEIWVSPSFNHFFNFKEGAGEVFNTFMDSLAARSGYPELSYAPVIGLGHSAAASWPYYFAAWNPGRTLACISVSGQWPYVRNTAAPDIWSPEQNIDYIPSLETMGEYEAAATWSAEGLKEREAHPHMPLSMLAVPAEGHFATSQPKTEFIAFYIKKAAQYRLPKKYPKQGPPVLIPVDPTKSGWLADKWRPDAPPSAPAAPVRRYTGNKTEAFWYFDEETVRAVENYGAQYKRLKPQLIGIMQEGKMAPQKNSHLQIDLKFLPAQDGITFHLNGAFYDTVGSGSPRLANWTGLPAGSPLGHAKDERPITIDWVAGPFTKDNDTTFRLQLAPGLDPNARQHVFTFIARHPGDAQYKPIVQQAQMTVPAKLTEGKEQHISFPSIASQRADAKSITLNAVSDADRPVYYYVLEGPARVEGNTLHFTPIPPKAKYPVLITVVAWQYGRTAEPKIQSAISVTQSIYITRP